MVDMVPDRDAATEAFVMSRAAAAPPPETEAKPVTGPLLFVSLAVEAGGAPF